MSFDIAKVSGEGMDNLEESNALPIIRILQDLSPEVKKRHEKYIEGAEAGVLYWNLNQSLLPQPLEFVPVRSVALYTEWVPKDEGGGLVAIHNLDIVNHVDYKKDVKKKNDEWLGDHELKYTRYWMILAKIDDEWQKAMLAMTSTQLRVARQMSKEIKNFSYDGDLKEVQPPMFARTFNLETVLEKNAADQEYYNFKVTANKVLDFDADEALLTQAHEASKEAAAELPAPAAVETPALAAASVTTEDEPF